MKKLLQTLMLVFLATNTYAQWYQLGQTSTRDHYIDGFEIREKNGYLYAWQMADLYHPDSMTGALSYKIYSQIDCEIFKSKNLSILTYIEPMGIGASDKLPTEDEWSYPISGSLGYAFIESICWAYQNPEQYKDLVASQ